MSLSIITPHYNDLDGLKRIYNCLQVQTSTNWEWIVVDDFSESKIINGLKKWFQELGDKRVKLIFNTAKTNGSICRNTGADVAHYNHLIFLDADDYVSQDFVLHRDIEVHEFVVFKNKAVVDANGTQEIRPLSSKNYLNSFLNAKFIWQTTAILWNKSFFFKIGKFDANLQRLQDVELTIRALFVGTEYTVIDNEIDFFYCAKPIRSKPDIVKQSCNSVNYLISQIHSNYILDTNEHALLKAYYFACAKVLQRCNNRTDAVYVMTSLNVFYSKKYINIYRYSIGVFLLKLYQFHLISDFLFLKANRYFFKK